ncbi:MAG TPA: prepilin-type N-terminal cleavage/methylation domain-containing protein [bacterium (Candidatus Stahlbacteria)]|nr:prepilin-type N-terminal cleavage/methylation domain-containing protein [Candidatus Stahlbacteria bacterium]
MKNRGFTLIELMVALLIGAMFMAGAMAFFLSYNKETDKRQEQTETRETAIATVHYIVRNLRQSGWCADYQNLSFPRIIEGQQYSIGWAYDINSDSLYTAADNSGASLLGGPTDPLVDHYQGNALIADRISYIDFGYRNINGNPISTPVPLDSIDDIFEVTIRVVARSGREFSPPKTYTFPDMSTIFDGFYRYLAEQSVQLRNQAG